MHYRWFAEATNSSLDLLLILLIVKSPHVLYKFTFSTVPVLCDILFSGGSSESGSWAHGGSCWESEEATWQKCSSAGRSQEADSAARVLQQHHWSQSIARFLILCCVILMVFVLFCWCASTFDWLLVVMLQTQRKVTTNREALSRFAEVWLIAPSNNWSTISSSRWSDSVFLSLFLLLEQLSP